MSVKEISKFLLRDEIPRKTLLLVLLMAMVAMHWHPLQAAPVAQPSQSQLAGWLQVRIVAVECLKQSFDGIGADEIAVGGTVTSRYGVDKIAYIDLGNFKTGTTKHYDDWVLAEVPVSEEFDYSSVLVSVVEKDFGGSEDHLEKLVDAQFDLVQENLREDFLRRLEESETVLTANSQATFISFGWLLRQALKVAATQALTTILDKIWERLIGLIQDDIFKPQPIDIESGSGERQTGQIVFSEHGAEYRITYAWQIVNRSMVASSSPDYQPYRSFAAVLEELYEAWEASFSRVFLPLVSAY